MTNLKIDSDLESNLLYTEITNNHHVFRFREEPRTYGASVIHIPDQLRWELAVIYFYGEGLYDWELCYDTEITDDVIQYQTDDEIMKLLRRIKNLK